MIPHTISARRLNWLAHIARRCERKWHHDVVLLGERVDNGEIMIEPGLRGIPYAPHDRHVIPAGMFAALVAVDDLRAWLRERGA